MKTYLSRTPEPTNTNTLSRKKEQTSFFGHVQRKSNDQAQQKDPPGSLTQFPRYMPQPAAADNTYVKKPVIQPLNLDWDPKPSSYQAAEMANDVYNDFGKRVKISGGWVRLSGFHGIAMENKEVDFQSGVYYRDNPHTGKRAYVYATAGTASKRDALEDVLQPLGLSKQYAISISNALKINQFIAKDESLTFVGHSLGGGTAAANAMATGRQAITFNAAGVSMLTKRKHGLSSKNNEKNIKAFIIPGEAVDYYQGKVGSTADGKHTYVHPLFGSMNSFSAAVAKNTPQTILVRGYLHTMGQMMSALEESGYK